MSTSALITPLLPFILPRVANALVSYLPSQQRTQFTHRLLLISLVVAYISYSFYSTELGKVSGNYYTLLGIHRSDVILEALNSGSTGGERTIVKDAWKTFAKFTHPDRNKNIHPGLFRAGRKAYDALGDDGLRWVYDRFGEEALEWKGISTEKEYLWRGFAQSSGFYIVSGGTMVLMRLFGNGGSGTYWRHLLLPFLLVLEFSLLAIPSYPSTTSPIPIKIITFFFPNRTPHEHILFLHNAFVSLSMAITQLGPLFAPLRPQSKPMDEDAIHEVVEKLEYLTKTAQVKAAELFVGELTPFVPQPIHSASSVNITSHQNGEEDPFATLKDEMEQVMIDSRMRFHPVVAPVWGQSVAKYHSEQMAKEKAEAEVGGLGVSGATKKAGESMVFVDEEENEAGFESNGVLLTPPMSTRGLSPGVEEPVNSIEATIESN